MGYGRFAGLFIQILAAAAHYIIISICDAILITAHEYIVLFVFVMTSTVVPYGKVPL